MTLLLLLILPSLLIAGVVYQMIGSWIDENRFPPPGRLADIGVCKLHLKRQGCGRPVVVLETGIAATSISWSLVRTRLAQFSTDQVLAAALFEAVTKLGLLKSSIARS